MSDDGAMSDKAFHEDDLFDQIVPGNRLILANRGQEFGGAIWKSPTTGELLAGDTTLTHQGRWIIARERIVRVEVVS